jgi:hypothetical protein
MVISMLGFRSRLAWLGEVEGLDAVEVAVVVTEEALSPGYGLSRKLGRQRDSRHLGLLVQQSCHVSLLFPVSGGKAEL